MAPAAPGTAQKYLLEPGQLIDVDRYESVSPDVEALYLAATAGIYENIRDQYLAAFAFLVGLDAASITREVQNRYGFAYSTVSQSWAREPNHGDDEYPGAEWLGATDLIGTRNDFSGYQDTWGLYVDGRHGGTVPTPTHVDLRPLGLETGSPATYWGLPSPLQSNAGMQNAQRTISPGIVSWWTDIVIWKDLNLDRWVGERCDPTDDAEWDGEAGECRDPYNGGAIAQPNLFNDPNEGYRACGITNARNGVITLTPLTPWDHVYVARDIGSPTRGAWNHGAAVVEGPFTGMETLELRQEAQCNSTNHIKSRDGLLTLTGSIGNSFLSRIVITLTQEARDVERGIDLPPGQTVIDVDFIPGSL